ncbi:MAG: transcriptional regulator GcvA [Alphaproteobacteria bacterium]|nr:transcriptional regulator GcvA [Alphaproteobacteria bacterium]
MRLPPLNALRVFEAAGRLGSFSRAADELHITPSAVSHQIRSLEDHLQIKLFRRLNRKVVLTADGAAYLPPLQAAFSEIAAASHRIAAGSDSGQLAITLVPTFAIRWLVPRLSRFRKRHPDIEVRLSTSIEPVDFARSDVDLGIRYGKGDWPGLHRDKLFCEELFPVCSPALLEGDVPLEKPEDLVHHTLLHVIARIDDWRMWLTAAGVVGVDPEKGPQFPSSALALEAAAGGLGLAIGDRWMMSEDLKQGRLVEPFDFELPGESAYYLVFPTDRLDQPKIAAFRAWILDELAGDSEDVVG